MNYCTCTVQRDKIFEAISYNIGVTSEVSIVTQANSNYTSITCGTKEWTEVYSRNISNEESLTVFLDRLKSNANSEEVKKWINANLRNYLINYGEAKPTSKSDKNVEKKDWLKDALDRNEEVYRLVFTRNLRNNCLHIIDWINTIDKSKLSRISIPQAIESVKLWDNQKEKEISKEKSVEGATFISNIGTTGYKIVRLDTEDSLKYEGDLMNNCVGSYYTKILTGRVIIYSIRDIHNKPHVTINVTNNKVIQIMESNNKPLNNYKEYVEQALYDNLFPYETIDTLVLLDNKLSISIDRDGKVIDTNNLETGKEYSHLTIDNSDYDLPNGLRVGTMVVTDFIRLPENCRIKKLVLDGCTVSFPDNIHIGTVDVRNVVRKNLDFNSTKVGELNLTKCNKLYISKVNCERFYAKRCEIECILHSRIEYFTLYNTVYNSTVFPKNVKYMDLYNSYIKIPENVTLDTLVSTKDKYVTYPKMMKVANLNIMGDSKLKTIPIKYKITESLHVLDKKISIPENQRRFLAASTDNIQYITIVMKKVKP